MAGRVVRMRSSTAAGAGRTLLVAGVVMGLFDYPVSALGERTHWLVNEQAALASDAFDGVLRTALGFPSGLETPFRRGRDRWSVREWLAEGGQREDDRLRYLRHFHDPLKPWDEAGLNFGLGPFSSSIRWMQDPAQAGVLTGGGWSWPDARRLYYEALTEPDAGQRDVRWADLFRAIGQVMHLVADASVPEHTRNDGHPLGALKLENSYERWVGAQHAGGADREAAFTAAFLSGAIGFVSDVVGLALPAGEALAAVPVARLIDADRYDGSNPSITAPDGDPRQPVSAGLAEIANANFFSEDTLGGQYPSPGGGALVPVTLATPGGRVRRYWSRPPGHGLLPANPLRAECAAEGFSQTGLAVHTPPFPCVDPAVWRQVAAHMLPRAVGYARGALDYFFRGSVRVHRLFAADGQAYLEIENLTDEDMEGVFEVHARPMAGTPDEGRERTAIVDGGGPTLIGARETVTLPVTLRQVQNPTAAQVLVFRGRLGLESDAVVGQVFTVPYVLVTQTAYTADLSEVCRTSVAIPNLHTQSCEWRPVNVEVRGELVAASATVPAVKRIAVTSRFLSGVRLELDGVPVSGGTWLRQDEEPNPRAFSLTFGGGNPHGLALIVERVDGVVSSTPMAAVIMAVANANRYFTPASHGSDPPWYITARRDARVRVTAAPSYRTLSLSGHPDPTGSAADRYGIEQLRETISVGGAIASETTYFQRWVDYAEVFTSRPAGGPLVLLRQFESQLPTLPYGPPPVVPVEAVMERLGDGAAAEFVRTFVTAAPPPTTFTLVGRRQPGT